MSGTASPSGEQYRLRSGGAEAVVVGNGGGMRTFRLDGRDVLAGYDERSVCSAGRGQLLMPWPNRVRDGRYTVGDLTHQLDISETTRGHAIHGLVRWATWTGDQVSECEVAMRHTLWASHAYPFSLAFEVRYRLDAAGISVAMTAENIGDGVAPYGAGAHPYLASAVPLSSAGLEIPASRVLRSDERMIPVGDDDVVAAEMDFRRTRELGDVALDSCFTSLTRDADGHAVTRLHGGGPVLEVWQDATMDYVMVYRPAGDDVREIAVEPMTCAPDAFNSGAGLVRLTPGERHTCAWGVRVATDV